MPSSQATIEADVIISNPRWNTVLPDAESLVKYICTASLHYTGITAHLQELEFSVTLADDHDIQLLNKEYRQKDKPTNVLSFPNLTLNPQHFEQIETHEGYALLGDIILSLETLEREAAEQGKTLSTHFTHLLVHGLLHLLGYDHETEEEATVMEALEIEILATFGIASPYGENPLA